MDNLEKEYRYRAWICWIKHGGKGHNPLIYNLIKGEDEK